MGEQSELCEKAQASGEAMRGRGKESLQQCLINFHLYFAQTKGNTVGWKMTFGKSKLIDNRPGWHPLNFVREVETQCSYRKNPCCVTLWKRRPAEEENRFLHLWEITIFCVLNLFLRRIRLITLLLRKIIRRTECLCHEGSFSKQQGGWIC